MDRNNKAKVTTAFIGPMTRAGFLPTDDFASLLVEELASYSPADLKDAASHIIRTRRFPNFPTVGEIVEALNHVRETKPAAHPGIRYSPDEIEHDKLKFQSYIDEYGTQRWIRPSFIEKKKYQSLKDEGLIAEYENTSSQGERERMKAAFAALLADLKSGRPIGGPRNGADRRHDHPLGGLRKAPDARDQKAQKEAEANLESLQERARKGLPPLSEHAMAAYNAKLAKAPKQDAAE